MLDRRRAPGGRGLTNTRVLRAGFVAGLILILGEIGLYFFLGLTFPAERAALFEDVELSRSVLGWNAFVRLLMGCAVVWLYAAARFRLRSGFRTALRVGFAIWLLSYLPGAWLLNVMGAAPGPLLVTMSACGLVITMLAALAGGVIHKATKSDTARY